MPSTASKIHAMAIGRRKTSSASVRIVSGDGSVTVNNLPADQYFPGIAAKARYQAPFKAIDVNKYSAVVRVVGGGRIGQLDATVLGISRALVEIKDTFKPQLRTAGLMTRNPRQRQRRMIGTGGKSRRQKQSPKR